MREVCEKSGVPEETFRNWFRNSPTSPSIYDLVAVSSVLGVSVEYLVTGEDSKMFPLRFAPLLDSITKLSDEDLNMVNAVIDGLVLRRAGISNNRAEGFG